MHQHKIDTNKHNIIFKYVNIEFSSHKTNIIFESSNIKYFKLPTSSQHGYAEWNWSNGWKNRQWMMASPTDKILKYHPCQDKISLLTQLSESSRIWDLFIMTRVNLISYLQLSFGWSNFLTYGGQVKNSKCMKNNQESWYETWIQEGKFIRIQRRSFDLRSLKLLTVYSNCDPTHSEV